MERENIKPEIYLQDMLNLDVEKSKQELHQHFDNLLDAREELFEKKLTQGIEKHMNFLKFTKK